MDDLSSQIEEDFLTCKICFELYTQPKILPCVHTFCLECISQHFKKNKKGDKALCPLCREPFVLPSGNPANLTTNFYINSLEDVVNTKRNAKQCSFCALLKNEPTTGTWICIDCEDFLCDTCKEHHEGTRLTFNHKIITVEALLSGNHDKDIRSRHGIPCPKHKDECLKFFCETCSASICRDCALLDHKMHKCVSSADALNDRRGHMECSVEIAASNMKVLEQKQTYVTDAISDLDNSEESQLSSLKDYGMSLKCAIDRKIEDTENHIRLVSKESRTKLKERKDIIDNEIKALMEPLEFCKDLLENGRDEEILYFQETFKDGLTKHKGVEKSRPDVKWNIVDITLQDDVSRIVPNDVVKCGLRQYTFSEDSATFIEADDNHSQPQDGEEVNVTDASTNDDDTARTERSQSSIVHSRQQSSEEQCQGANREMHSSGTDSGVQESMPTRSGKYRLERTFNCYVGCESEIVPELTGIAWLQNRQLAVCDVENRQLKIFLPNGNLHWCMDVEMPPVGIAVVDNTIALAAKDCVLIYQNDIKTGLINYSVDTFYHIAASTSEILLFGTDSNEVRRYDTLGKRQGMIQLDSSVQPLAVSSNDELLVISDKRSSETLIFDYHGTKLRSVEKDKARWLPDAHCLQEDRVLLLDKTSSKVFILQNGVKYLGGWSTEPEIRYPSCIDFHSEGFLAIGGAGGNVAIYHFV